LLLHIKLSHYFLLVERLDLKKLLASMLRHKACINVIAGRCQMATTAWFQHNIVGIAISRLKPITMMMIPIIPIKAAIKFTTKPLLKKRTMIWSVANCS